MYTVKNGKIMVMVQDSKRKDVIGYKWVYIPARKWEKMTDEQKKRYIA